MIENVQAASGKLRQSYLLDVEEPHATANGRRNSAPPRQPQEDERLCCEELDRIQARLDEIGELLRELLAAAAVSHTAKQSYSTHEVARILGRRPFTVREWCRLGRVNARRALSGRGVDKEWRITHEELERIQNEGLLPLPQRY